jgi:polyisoprenyl-phosphate glycosyltransferase
MATSELLISVVVPVYNEAAGLEAFHRSLLESLDGINNCQFEIIYSDDGSSDKTAEIVRQLCATDGRVKLISLSRNFGKESALAAGIAEAGGEATILIDGDGQHPVDRIPDFIMAWRNGAQVVVGVYRRRQHESWMKKLASRIFSTIMNHLTDQKNVPGSTDFRLIDRRVQQAFLQLHETDRMTRGLIDWLGFRRDYVPIRLKVRSQGEATQSYRKLWQLATNSIVSMTTGPLYFFGCLGILITSASFVLGMAVIIEQLILGDPLRWKFTGTAMLSILVLFLVGIVLLSQGMLSLYVLHIHNQSKQRPLYIVDEAASAGLTKQAKV